MRPSSRLWALVATTAIVASAALPAQVAGAKNPPPGSAEQVAALVAASVKISTLTSAQLSALPHAGEQNADVALKIPALCELDTKCYFGDLNAKTTVVLIGDSHARMWLPPLTAIATADQFKILLLGRDGCPLVSDSLHTFDDCVGVMSSAIKAIRQIKPAAVIVSNRTTWLTTITMDQWQTAMTKALQAIAASGAKIAVIGDIQATVQEPIDCLSIHPTAVQRCSNANPDLAKPGHYAAEEAAAAAVGVPYVDPQPWLCTPKRCSMVIGPFFTYWDEDHISIQYADYLQTVLGAALKSTLP